MRVVLQRVKYAKVSVGGEVAGQIEKGYLLLLGIGPDDTKATAEKGKLFLDRWLDDLTKLINEHIAI